MTRLILRRAALSETGWSLLAAAFGWLIATQSLGLTALLAPTAFALLALITPLVALVVLLIFAPLRTLIATEANVGLPLDVGQLALIGLLLAWGFHFLAHRRSLRSIPFSPLFIPVLAFTVAAAMSAFNAYSLGAWLNEWLKWVQIAVLIALCLSLKRWEILVFGVVVAGTANAVIGIYEFFGGSGALHLVVEGRFFRAFGTFGQPNPFGGFMGLIAPVAFAAALGYALRAWERLRARQSFVENGMMAVFYAVCGALMAVALVMSWSRGAWLGFGIALVAMAFALPRRIEHGIALVAAIAGLFAVLWIADLIPASIAARIESATQESFAFNDVRGVDITSDNWAVVERLAHWQAALNMATAHPWLGVGFGNYEVAYPQFRLINWDMALGHAHNYYLNVLAETGMIGLAVYLAGWVSIGLLTWRTRRHPDTLAHLIAVGLFGTWVYLAIHSLTDNLYVNNVFLHLGVLLGVLAALHLEARSDIWSVRA